MTKWFNIPVLGVVCHDKKTREILKPYANRQQSKYVRDLIVKFAIDKGFEDQDALVNGEQPYYLPLNIWQRVIAMQSRARRMKKENSRVDYTYVIAFWWLKTLPKFMFYPKSKLLREIICHQ